MYKVSINLVESKQVVTTKADRIFKSFSRGGDQEDLTDSKDDVQKCF